MSTPAEVVTVRAWLRALTEAFLLHHHGEVPPNLERRRQQLGDADDFELLAILRGERRWPEGTRGARDG